VDVCERQVSSFDNERVERAIRLDGSLLEGMALGGMSHVCSMYILHEYYVDEGREGMFAYRMSSVEFG
jgi:hypothetical protein